MTSESAKVSRTCALEKGGDALEWKSRMCSTACLLMVTARSAQEREDAAREEWRKRIETACQVQEQPSCMD